jgi:uncharacterized glyoxalase superfamily protein PhnB
MQLSTTQVWVRDQDEAVTFWTDQVGFEIKEDVTLPEMNNFRWVSVGPRGQEGTSIVLMEVPGQPVMDDATKQQVEQLVAKGFATGQFFSTENARTTYDRLVAAGVEVVGEPTEQPYGIDFGFRDPSGNQYRVAQRP